MFDAIEIEKRGIPTVTIVHDVFAAVASLHARTLHMPDVPLIIEPAPESGVVGSHIEEVADATINELLASLTAEDTVED